MSYKSPQVGHVILAGFYGVNKELFRDNSKLEGYLTESLKSDNFTILDSISYPFEPQGFTTLKLLSESAAEIHTYPEYDSLIFLLYSCRGPNDARKSYESFKKKVSPKKSKIIVNTKVPVIFKK